MYKGIAAVLVMLVFVNTDAGPIPGNASSKGKRISFLWAGEPICHESF